MERIAERVTEGGGFTDIIILESTCMPQASSNKVRRFKFKKSLCLC